MSFFAQTLRPALRILTVSAACLGLTVGITWLALMMTASKPNPDVGAANIVTAVKAPAEIPLTAEEIQKQIDDKLYGYGHAYHRRVLEVMKDADYGVLADFHTFYADDFRDTFGSRVNSQELTAPSRENILGEVFQSLSKESASLGMAQETDFEAIALYLSLTMDPDNDGRSSRWGTLFKPYKNEEGFWTIQAVTDWKEKMQLAENRQGVDPNEKKFRDALHKIPLAYGLYLSSLVIERPQAIKDMDSLLALPEAQQKPLRAIAKYRRARLTMSLKDWDQLTDAQAQARLAALRADLSAVAVHAQEGSLNPFLLSDNAKYWLAYSRSMILPGPRLIRLGEADFAGAFATYLTMPSRGEANAVNSSFFLARKIFTDDCYAECVKDPDLRKLLTLYLCGESGGGYGSYVSRAEAQKGLNGWLDALEAANIGPAFAPLHLAMLQYRAGRWKACLQALNYTPPSHPLRRLLTARCALQLGGTIAVAEKLLEVTGPDQEATLLASFEQKPKPAPNLEARDFSILIRVSDETECANRVLGERGMLSLARGDFQNSFRLFSEAGFIDETNYVGECLLSLEELIQVNATLKSPSPLKGPDDFRGWDEKILTPRSLLASRLFRANRLEEALAYVAPNLRTDATNYVLLRRLAENTEVTARSRADAYWRCALLAARLGEDIFRSPIGLSWSSDGGRQSPANWYEAYDFLPAKRVGTTTKGESVIPQVVVRASAQETQRLKEWLVQHVDNPIRSERDARYLAFEHALQAARLLPDHDPAGGLILQYAGNLLKYREPKAAVPAFRLLATRFSKTPFGAAALKANWFAKDRPEVPSDVISK